MELDGTQTCELVFEWEEIDDTQTNEQENSSNK